MSEQRPKGAVAQPDLAFAARDFLVRSMFVFFVVLHLFYYSIFMHACLFLV
jgi:hypothetical protein